MAASQEIKSWLRTVATETKQEFIPFVETTYGDSYPPYSHLYQRPTSIQIQRKSISRSPTFTIEVGDPVMKAFEYATLYTQMRKAEDGRRVRVPFICAANEKKPGGEWRTANMMGYEEQLCRRSNLSATLSSPWSGSPDNYPIPSQGAILSDSVMVYRGPHDRYDKLKNMFDLPVISVPPTRWPKLKESGTKYSLEPERDMLRDKLRGALHICLHKGYDRVVIGDFGLGNHYRNPPQELAEVWRDVLLFDPVLFGQFAHIVFVFENPEQSTVKHIQDAIAKKENGSNGGKPQTGLSFNPSVPLHPTDLQIFSDVFSPTEVDRVLRGRPDPRYSLKGITERFQY